MAAAPTKKVARVIVLHGKNVLLVEKEAAPGWFELPGGQRKRRESNRAAALRELREETGLEVARDTLRRWGQATLTTTHDAGQRVAVTVYTLKLEDKLRKRVRPHREIARCRWFRISTHHTKRRIERKTALILKYFHLFTQK